MSEAKKPVKAPSSTAAKKTANKTGNKTANKTAAKKQTKDSAAATSAATLAEAAIHQVVPVQAAESPSLSAPVIPDHEALQRRAYEFWVEGGHQHGHDRDHWARAQQELSRS